MLRFSAALLTLATLVAPTTGNSASAEHPLSSLPMAHQAVIGAAGPYARATVLLRRTSNEPSASFTGVIHTPEGREIVLAGPDEPADFFQFDVVAVLFTPIERHGRNGVVILYDSSQIGPGHGTQQRVLVYRVGAGSAQRVSTLERRLDGAASAAEARRRLRRLVR